MTGVAIPLLRIFYMEETMVLKEDTIGWDGYAFSNQNFVVRVGSDNNVYYWDTNAKGWAPYWNGAQPAVEVPAEQEQQEQAA